MSFQPPLALERFSITIAFGAGPNPVETAPQGVGAISRGAFLYRVINVATGYFFDIEFQGGTGDDTNANDPANRVNYIQGTAIDHLLNNLGVVASNTASPTQTFTVTTDAADGSREYEFTFSTFRSFPATVFKSGGAALTGDLTLQATRAALAST